MVVLKYIGKHKPQGMIIEVNEQTAKTLIDTNEYVLVGGDIKKKPVKVKQEDSEDTDSEFSEED